MLKIFKDLNLTTQGKITLLIEGLGFLAFMILMAACYVAVPAILGV